MKVASLCMGILMDYSTSASGCHHTVNQILKHTYSAPFVAQGIARSKRNVHNKNSVVQGESLWLREMS